MSHEDPTQNKTSEAPVTPAVPEKQPHDLINKHDVEQALLADKGLTAKLNSFTIKDFTTKGDNYACVVSSVEVEYEKEGKKQETSYVVKLNPCRAAGFDKMTEVVFEKETGFYTQILPLINNVLINLKEPKLRTPTYLFHNETKGEQVIYLNDLRRLGYKMFDRKKGMDAAHVELILQELARLHAASVVLMSSKEFKGVDMLERFPVLRDGFEAMQEDGNSFDLDAMFAQSFENSAKIAERNKGYEYVAEFMRAKIETAKDDYKDLLSPCDPFRFILHGDCWNNNFLFRYDRDGAPAECCLLDLQVSRIGSPALDLNYMLYCSMDGDVRIKNLKNFFNSYYASFASIMASAQHPLDFTLDQLKKEFYSKNLFGLFMGMILIPIVLMDSEDAPSFDDVDTENMQKSIEEFQEKVMLSVQKNPLLIPRFLSMFDEMKEAGLFKTKQVSRLVQRFNSIEN